jgi:hypothetical protein
VDRFTNWAAATIAVFILNSSLLATSTATINATRAASSRISHNPNRSSSSATLFGCGYIGTGAEIRKRLIAQLVLQIKIDT